MTLILRLLIVMQEDREITYLVKLLTCCDLDIFILFNSGTFKLDDWCLLWQYDWCALFDITPLLQLSKPGKKKEEKGCSWKHKHTLFY